MNPGPHWSGAVPRLTDLIAWAARVQDSDPVPFRSPLLVRFVPHDPAAGATDTGEVPSDTLARRYRVPVRTVIVPVGDLPGAADRSAADLGRDVLDQALDDGLDILIAEAAVPALPAAAVLARLAGTDAASVWGWVDDERAWMADVTRLRTMIWQARDVADDNAADVLGGPVVAALIGFLSRAAERCVPVILDGPTAYAAALAVARRDPAVTARWLAGMVGADPGLSVALTALELAPVLELETVPAGCGGLLTLELLQAALVMHTSGTVGGS